MASIRESRRIHSRLHMSPFVADASCSFCISSNGGSNLVRFERHPPSPAGWCRWIPTVHKAGPFFTFAGGTVDGSRSPFTGSKPAGGCGDIFVCVLGGVECRRPVAMFGWGALFLFVFGFTCGP